MLGRSQTDGQTEGPMDRRGLLMRRSLLCKKDKMRSVCAARCVFPNPATFFKIFAFWIDSFSFVTHYKVHMKCDQNKVGKRQGFSQPHCTEDRLTKLLLPTLLPNRWLTLYLNREPKLGKLHKRTEKISLMTLL
jgi:hypothetical protein